MRDGWTLTRVREIVRQVKDSVQTEDGKTYRLLGVRWYGMGSFVREEVTTKSSKATRLFAVTPGDFVYNRLFAWKGSFGVIPTEQEGCFVSGEFPLFRTLPGRITSGYLNLYMCQPSVWSQVEIESTGSTSVSRNRWKEDRFLDWEILLPPLEEQRRIVDVVGSVDAYIDALKDKVAKARTARNAVLHELLSAGGPDWTETTVENVLERSIGGVWGADASVDEVDVTVVRSTEFTNFGRLNYETGVIRSVTLKQLNSRVLRPGDILLEKSGGGPQQPVGRVVFVGHDIPPRHICSNFVQVISPNQTTVDARFLFLVLWRWHLDGRTLEYQSQTTGIRNLRTTDYLGQTLALPTLEEQRRIVDIVTSMDDVITASEKAVAEAVRLRSGLLSDLLTGEHEIPASYDSLLGAA